MPLDDVIAYLVECRNSGVLTIEDVCDDNTVVSKLFERIANLRLQVHAIDNIIKNQSWE